MDRLEEEVNKFKSITKAIEIKEKDLQELYGIEKSVSTLAGLVETQNQKRREFESEMALREREVKEEI